jgi:hypothetical protein
MCQRQPGAAWVLFSRRMSQALNSLCYHHIGSGHPHGDEGEDISSLCGLVFPLLRSYSLLYEGIGLIRKTTRVFADDDGF